MEKEEDTSEKMTDRGTRCQLQTYYKLYIRKSVIIQDNKLRTWKQNNEEERRRHERGNGQPWYKLLSSGLITSSSLLVDVTYKENNHNSQLRIWKEHYEEGRQHELKNGRPWYKLFLTPDVLQAFPYLQANHISGQQAKDMKTIHDEERIGHNKQGNGRPWYYKLWLTCRRQI